MVDTSDPPNLLRKPAHSKVRNLINQTLEPKCNRQNHKKR